MKVYILRDNKSELRIFEFLLQIFIFVICCITVVAQERAIISTKLTKLKLTKNDKSYIAIIKLPHISGLRNKRIEDVINESLTLEKLFETSIKEEKEGGWLTDIGYQVRYNRHSLLDIEISMSGVGAYPDTMKQKRVFDLRTGSIVKVQDLFFEDQLSELALKVNSALRVECEKYARINAKKYDEEVDALMLRYEEHRFTFEKLNNFSLSDNGITFNYDFLFPHVAKALEPPGKYYFTYRQLTGMINPNGLLRDFLNPKH